MDIADHLVTVDILSFQLVTTKENLRYSTTNRPSKFILKLSLKDIYSKSFTLKADELNPPPEGL